MTERLRFVSFAHCFVAEQCSTSTKRSYSADDSPLSRMSGALGPTSMATAPAPPVGRALPVAYTAMSAATTTAYRPAASVNAHEHPHVTQSRELVTHTHTHTHAHTHTHTSMRAHTLRICKGNCIQPELRTRDHNTTQGRHMFKA